MYYKINTGTRSVSFLNFVFLSVAATSEIERRGSPGTSVLSNDNYAGYLGRFSEPLEFQVL